MTTLQFLGALRRRWYVVVAGAMVTYAIAAGLLSAKPLYSTQTEVLFVEAGITADEAYLEGPSDRVVPFVASVERVVNRGAPVQFFNSAAATLPGAGVRQGVRVTLPNAGNQWEYSFPRPSLVIEVVDSSPDAVLAAHAEAAQRVRSATAALQKDQGVLQSQMVTPVPLFETPSVAYVGTTKRGQARALVALTAVCMGLTAAAVVLVDRWAVLRRGRRRPSRPWWGRRQALSEVWLEEERPAGDGAPGTGSAFPVA